MSTKGLVGGTTNSTTLTAQGNATESMITSTTQQTSVVNASIGSTPRSVSASAVSNTPVPVEYEGLSSSSLHIVVDNNNRTISGDVIWKSMIAQSPEQEDSSHAYPAHKARLKFNDVEDRLGSIESNLSQASSDALTAKSLVNACDARVEEYRASVQSMSNQLNSVLSSVGTEAVIRADEDLKIKLDLSNLRSNLEDSLSNIQTTLTDRIESQNTIVSGVEEHIQLESLRARTEEERLAEVDTQLQKNLHSIVSSISTSKERVDDLHDRVANLEINSVNGTVADHTESIRSLSTTVLVNQEINTRRAEVAQQERTTLRDAMYKNRSDIGKLQASVATCELKIPQLEAETRSHTETLEQLSTALNEHIELNRHDSLMLLDRINGETTMRQRSDSFHENEIKRLDGRISRSERDLLDMIDIHAKESRYNDNLIMEEIRNITFEFIDAGTAPI